MDRFLNLLDDLLIQPGRTNSLVHGVHPIRTPDTA
jgi:hypothetical protein